jgi:hypothetical protein
MLKKMDRTIEIVIFPEGRSLLARTNSSVTGGFATALCETVRKLYSVAAIAFGMIIARLILHRQERK